MFGSVENSAKYISLGPACYRKRVSNIIWVSPSQVHRGGPPAGSGNGTRSESSVRERGHRICASLQQANRVLQPVFHSSKEGLGVASHFRSSSSERLRPAAQVQNLNFETNRATDQIRGLVCHDRSQGLILPHIHPSVSQEVPELRFWGQSIPISVSSIRPSIITPHFDEMRRCSPGASSASGYSHYELHRQLVDSSSVASVGSAASRCRSGPHERSGVQLNAKKSVLSPLQRTTFLGVVWDSKSMQARLSPTLIESILWAVKRIRLGQSLTVKQFQRLLGLMAAASNVIAFRLLYMRPLHWWLRNKSFFPRGATPFAWSRSCDDAFVPW